MTLVVTSKFASLQGVYHLGNRFRKILNLRRFSGLLCAIFAVWLIPLRDVRAVSAIRCLYTNPPQRSDATSSFQVFTTGPQYLLPCTPHLSHDLSSEYRCPAVPERNFQSGARTYPFGIYHAITRSWSYPKCDDTNTGERSGHLD